MTLSSMEMSTCRLTTRWHSTRPRDGRCRSRAFCRAHPSALCRKPRHRARGARHAKLDRLVAKSGAATFRCDGTRIEDVDRLFAEGEAGSGPPDVVVCNAGAGCRTRRGARPDRDRARRPRERDGRPLRRPGDRADHAAPRFRHDPFHRRLGEPQGTFGGDPVRDGQVRVRRGRARASLTSLGLSGIHVVDGGIGSAAARRRTGKPLMLDPEAIADAYMHLLGRPGSLGQTRSTCGPERRAPDGAARTR